jgi:hypothetical protein
MAKYQPRIALIAALIEAFAAALCAEARVSFIDAPANWSRSDTMSP